MRAFLDVLGLSDELADNDLMYWGRTLEDVVAAEFCRQYVVDYPGAAVTLERYDEMFVHDKFDWAGCTPDYSVTIDGRLYGLETKTAHSTRLEDWLTELPERPELQTLHQMAIMDEWEGAFVACLVYAPKFIYYPVYKNEGVLAGMLGQEFAFWRNHIEPRKAPAPTEDDGPYLNRLYAESNKTIIELPVDAYQLCLDYWEGKEREKEGKATKQKSYNTLKNLIKNADAGTIGNLTVRWTHGRKQLTIDQAEIVE